jgi:glycosyltransferase involved in cell wall biosynthesis
MKSFPRVSVVIPTYERCGSLGRLLRALCRQTIPSHAYEVIVIVDGSTDGTRELLERFDTPYALTWRWQQNGGRAAACNAGIRLCQSPLVVLLDDDMEPAPGCLEAHIACHADGVLRAVMGAAPMVVTPGSPAVVEYVGRKFNRHLAMLATAGHRLSLRSFYSGNLSVPRRVLEDVGGFDEAFTVYGNEDLELSCRLRAAGADILFSGAPLAHQHYDKTFAELARDNISKGITAVLLARKHPAMFTELKLAAHNRGSLKRRLALDALVALTRVWPRVVAFVTSAIGLSPRLRNEGQDRAYAFVLDYFFMVGATNAQARVRHQSARAADHETRPNQGRG